MIVNKHRTVNTSRRNRIRSHVCDGTAVRRAASENPESSRIGWMPTAPRRTPHRSACRHQAGRAHHERAAGDSRPTTTVLFCPKEKPRLLAGFRCKALAMTYSCMDKPHYHRRMSVSLPSSGWDRVVPLSYVHQGEGGVSRSAGAVASISHGVVT